MSFTTWIRRALLLALLLPALLVPSGWSLRLCFCAAMSGQAATEQESCCSKLAAKSCCDAPSSTAAAGEHRECRDCKRFGADNRALPPTLATPPDVPVVLAFEAPRWTMPEAVEVLTCASSVVARAHAPPGIEPVPPLRI